MGATFARSHTFIDGETLTDVLQNGIETNILNNFTFAGLDDYSADNTEMRTTTDPYPASAESLATAGSGELARIRYVMKQFGGEAQWYIDPQIALKHFVYVATAGTDTYTATLDPAITAYTTGLLYFVKFGIANTSATPTLNLNSLGAITIKKENSLALAVRDIKVNHYAVLIYNGTDMILLNPSKAEIFTASSGTDTYTATNTETALVSEKLYYIKFGNANTSTTPTLNINSLGAKTIKKFNSAALLAGDIPANHNGILKYDGTDMILVNPLNSATQAEMEAATGNTSYATPVNIKWNPGVAKSYIRFNGTGTPAISAQYNITSLTDDGTGLYTITLDVDHSSNSYIAMGMAKVSDDSSNEASQACIGALAGGTYAIETTNANGSRADCNVVMSATWGDQ